VASVRVGVRAGFCASGVAVGVTIGVAVFSATGDANVTFSSGAAHDADSKMSTMLRKKLKTRMDFIGCSPFLKKD